mmetsp:Transcript_67816/g.151447  ORF Transcript_67816/g.151447 Transcript_67816/m.151447 type:complete len:200 (-) Transcript_67816:159-758(-)
MDAMARHLRESGRVTTSRHRVGSDHDDGDEREDPGALHAVGQDGHRQSPDGRVHEGDEGHPKDRAEWHRCEHVVAFPEGLLHDGDEGELRRQRACGSKLGDQIEEHVEHRNAGPDASDVRAEAGDHVLVLREAVRHILAHRRGDQPEEEKRERRRECIAGQGERASDDGGLGRGKNDPSAKARDEVRERERDRTLRVAC